MELFHLVILLVLLCIVVIAFDRWRASVRRRQARDEEFPRRWFPILRRNFPIFERLPATLKEDLQEKLRIFIDEKEFEACGGLESVTEEMMVTIAAHAALLQLNKRGPYYARLRSVLVYPGDYVVPEDDEYAEEVRSGESWTTGSVVVSWDAVKHAVRDPRRAPNVLLHEFAHQLDDDNGESDGAPELGSASAYRAWARVFGEHYKDLRTKVERGEPTDLDEYGAENPAEFFAVATEAFFGTPRTLQRNRPELYDQLRRFYKVDPGRWGSGSGIADPVARR